MHTCAEEKREREREKTVLNESARQRRKSRVSVKSIRDTLVEVYILVCHEHKVIRMAVVFNLCFSCRDTKVCVACVLTRNKKTHDLKKNYISIFLCH